MSSAAHSEPRRGRPRSDKAREAILAAAGELLLGHGLRDVSMDAVATRAGVSKATIYRWWPSKEALVVDTIFQEWSTGRPPTPATGSLRSDLLSYLRPWVRQARRRPLGRVVAELAAAVHADAEFAKLYHERFFEPRRETGRLVLESAINRGEIHPVDIDFALDLVFGPIFHRLLNAHAPVSDRFVERVVDALLVSLQSPNRHDTAEGGV